MAKKTTKKTTQKTTKKTTKKVAKKTTTSKKAAPQTTKTSATKKTTKKVAKKATKKVTKKITKKAAKKAASKKTAKPVKKTNSKKTASQKTTKKSTAQSKASTKKVSKKTTKKVTKKTTKKVTKKVTKKTPPKAAPKPASQKPSTKKAAEKTEPSKPDSQTTPPPKTDAKGNPIKPPRTRSRKKAPKNYAPPERPLLLGPDSLLKGGPLIKSTKRKKKSTVETKVSKRTKTPFTPKQLDAYKLILLNKRAELVGDVQHLEDEALRSNTGETQTASNATEFGTESFEQSLNLDLAAADRKLIAEIDEALDRIADRTYGLCIETHEPIKKERLEELPWAKYSIAAARIMDQRHPR